MLDSKTIRFWDVVAGEEKDSLVGHNHMVESIAFSPDEKTFASASSDGTVKVWDLTKGKERLTLEAHPDFFGYHISVAFSPDGKCVARGGSRRDGPFDPKNPKVLGEVKVWDVDSGKVRIKIEGPPALIRSVTFSPDGKLLASACHDNTVRLWDVATGKERAVFKGHKERATCAQFSPDGKTIASGSADGTIKLWDVPETKKDK